MTRRTLFQALLAAMLPWKCPSMELRHVITADGQEFDAMLPEGTPAYHFEGQPAWEPIVLNAKKLTAKTLVGWMEE